MVDDNASVLPDRIFNWRMGDLSLLSFRKISGYKREQINYSTAYINRGDGGRYRCYFYIYAKR